MRTIKIRAWDKISKYWASVFYATEDYLKNYCGDSSIAVFDQSGRYKFIQWTGLFDKNGREIWEGDIVHQFAMNRPNDNYFHHEVLFKNGAFGYHPFNEKMDFISYSENSAFKWKNDKSDYIKVIGNIYENPELVQTLSTMPANP